MKLFLLLLLLSFTIKPSKSNVTGWTQSSQVGNYVPGYTALWILLRFCPGFTFENFLDWPEFEENWPDTFDKGLFKEEDPDDVQF